MLEYKTILEENSDEFIERKSRFIGYVKPIKTEQEAITFINEKKSINWDATHNVYAYSLREGNIKRYSDDGEPQGTAGIPVLEVLNKSNIVDAVVVVTRYFGGVLLGAGGLVRAYSHGAKIGIDAGKILIMRECILAEFTCDYHQYGKLSALVPSFGGVVDDTVYTDIVTVYFHIEADKFAYIEKQFEELSCGSVKIKIKDTKFFSFDK